MWCDLLRDTWALCLALSTAASDLGKCWVRDEVDGAPDLVSSPPLLSPHLCWDAGLVGAKLSQFLDTLSGSFVTEKMHLLVC